MMEGAEDEAFAQEWVAILTNPHPAGIHSDEPYGLLEDGIDRHDGFGRDVWVESLKVVDGQPGAELVVEFGLALPLAPDFVDVPPSGAVVTVVISADAWDRVLTDHARGDVDLYFAELMGPREEDETFVVFHRGDLARSTREQLPPVRGRAWERTIEPARANDRDAPLRWVESPPHGPGFPP